jgi:hypothetical protein
MTTGSGGPGRPRRQGTSARGVRRQVKLGDQRCPRCGKYFTLSYWNGRSMIQARCLSCDLKWPLPDVV